MSGVPTRPQIHVENLMNSAFHYHDAIEWNLSPILVHHTAHGQNFRTPICNDSLSIRKALGTLCGFEIIIVYPLFITCNNVEHMLEGVRHRRF